MDRLPDFVRHELELGAPYRGRIDTPAGAVHFRRSRWEHLNDGSDAPALRHREGAAWLLDGEAHVALLTLEEFKVAPPGPLYWEEFFHCADGLSQQAGDAVAALREVWGGYSPSAITDYGSIALITGAWIAPAHRARLDMRTAFDATLSAWAPKHAIAVLFAYPNDGEQDRPDAVVDLGSFEHRQAALIRLYARVLGFQLMPVKDARRDTMWRPRADLADLATMRPARS